MGAQSNKGAPGVPRPGKGQYLLPGRGRPRGSVNKIGAQCKENIIEVFSKIGGVEAMCKWARRNRTEFYRLYARLIPNYVVAQVDVRDASEYTDDELLGIIASAGSAGGAGAEKGESISSSVH